MWVKNEYGHLLNLQHANVLRLVTEHEEVYVQARFGSTEAEYADLTRGRTEPEAQRVLDAIGQALSQGVPFLDLTS